MSDSMGGNKAGKYEVVRNQRGMSDAGSRLYYQTYIPADLNQLEKLPFQSDKLSSALNAIYREIGVQQGLCFFEDNFKRRNRLLYKQELTASLEYQNKKIELADIFGLRMSETVSAGMDFYDGMEQKKEEASDDTFLEDILLGTAKMQGHFFRFRKNQIWEESNIRRISLREHNPPAPERIADLMIQLDNYRRRDNGIDAMVQAALLSYQFLTILPYEEDNEIWASFLLNFYLQDRGCPLGYYVPFAKQFFTEDENRRQLMKQVREEASYEPWIWFFLKIMEDSIAGTNQLIMRLSQIHKETLDAISGEKQKNLLIKILDFMEDSPVFVIGDIEESFDVAYNTAAKAVSFLEKRGIVREISHKQRYRIYCYDKYMRELLGTI